MRIKHSFINFISKADKVSDYIPVLSTFSNLVDLLQKVVLRSKPPAEIEKNRYYRQIKDKSVLRCLVLLIPVFGNISVALWDSGRRDRIINWYKNNGTQFDLNQLRTNETKDSKLMLALIEDNHKAFRYAYPDLQESEDFALKAAKINGEVVQHWPEQFKKNKEMLLQVLKEQVGALKYVDTTLKKDEAFLLDALTFNRDCIAYIDEVLKNDLEFMTQAIQRNPKVYKELEGKLENNEELKKLYNETRIKKR